VFDRDELEAKRTPMAKTLDQTYPSLTRWVKAKGWIEIGFDGMRRREGPLSVAVMIEALV
jgi:hypothetical protein